jgi:hypothetical protein
VLRLGKVVVGRERGLPKKSWTRRGKGFERRRFVDGLVLQILLMSA